MRGLRTLAVGAFDAAFGLRFDAAFGLRFDAVDVFFLLVAALVLGGDGGD